jgi:hypothetical protein
MTRKILYLDIAPVSESPLASIDMTYGHDRIGRLMVNRDDLAEFVESLQLGFTVAINQPPDRRRKETLTAH